MAKPHRTSSSLKFSNVMVDINSIKVTREKISSDAFAHVYKASYKGKIWAAKEFLYSDSTVSLDAAFDSKGNPRNDNSEVLLEECHRCLKLQHPNVVLFLGLCYSSPAVPTLVVEKLRETLAFFLKNNADVESACKLSILLDVAQGLMYLHSQEPQITHGCLTSQNVLLSDLRQAKITGDSTATRLLKKASLRRSGVKSTEQEAAADFFPQGVKLDSCGLELSLDVFSFGGVILHVLTQKWPKPKSYANGVSEFNRRSTYIKAVSDHRFKELIKGCMDEDSKVRPTIFTVHAVLQNIAHDNEEASLIPATKDSTKVSKIVRQSQESNKEIQVDKEIRKIIEQKEQKEQIIEQKEQIIKKQKEMLCQTAESIQQKDNEIQKQKEILQQKIELIQRMDEEIQQKNKEIKEITKIKDEQIKHLNQEPKHKQRDISHQQGRGETWQKSKQVKHQETQTTEDIEIQVANKNQHYMYNQEKKIHQQEGCNQAAFSTAEMRTHCFQVPQEASNHGAGMRTIKPLQNATATNCYFNSVLQVLNQTTGFIKMMLEYSEGKQRVYMLSYKNEKRKVEAPIIIELPDIDQYTLLNTLKFFLEEVESDKSVFVQPDYVLIRLMENSSFKHQRYGQHTQEDSHELLRYLLYELKKEEIDLIKKEAQRILKSNLSLSSSMQLDEEHDKAAEKNLLRNASKEITPIEKVFGGEKLNTVICRECKTPSQTTEPFFDISLGLPDVEQVNNGYNWENSRQNTKHNVTRLWQPQQMQAKINRAQQNIHSTVQSSTKKYVGDKAQYGTDSVKHNHQAPREYNKKSVQELLMSQENFFYQPVQDETVPKPINDVEISLTEHTDVDNMDEDNMFICKTCTEKKGTTVGRDEVQLCLVTKQILIHKLPQVLILHFKRFKIDSYIVSKDSRHVTFSPVLNMAPYCSNKCLEDFGDANSNILYGLYGIVEHMGQTLQSGHYIAYVRRRPENQQKATNNSGWVYDHKAANDGKWFYTSDLTVKECKHGFERVKSCNAYMLFYELLPKKDAGSLV